MLQSYSAVLDTKYGKTRMHTQPTLVIRRLDKSLLRMTAANVTNFQQPPISGMLRWRL